MPLELFTAGTTLVFGTSAFTAKLEKIGQQGMTREALDASDLAAAAGWKTFGPSGQIDPGELQIEGFYDPDDSPPIDQPAETLTITYPVRVGDTNGATFVCQGFMTNFEHEGEVDGFFKFSATLKLSGQPTWTAGS